MKEREKRNSAFFLKSHAEPRRAGERIQLEVGPAGNTTVVRLEHELEHTFIAHLLYLDIPPLFLPPTHSQAGRNET